MFYSGTLRADLMTMMTTENISLNRVVDQKERERRPSMCVMLTVEIWEYFPLIVYWGCATGLGGVFTTGLTVMGLYFQQLLEWAKQRKAEQS